MTGLCLAVTRSRKISRPGRLNPGVVRRPAMIVTCLWCSTARLSAIDRWVCSRFAGAVEAPAAPATAITPVVAITAAAATAPARRASRDERMALLQGVRPPRGPEQVVTPREPYRPRIRYSARV